MRDGKDGEIEFAAYIGIDWADQKQRLRAAEFDGVGHPDPGRVTKQIRVAIIPFTPAILPHVSGFFVSHRQSGPYRSCRPEAYSA
jgi:hypothetical protein